MVKEITVEANTEEDTDFVSLKLPRQAKMELSNVDGEVYRDSIPFNLRNLKRDRKIPIFVERKDVPSSSSQSSDKEEDGMDLRRSEDETQGPDLQKYNTKPLPRNANTYRLENFKKNAMIIFNYENLEGFAKRKGTNEDVAALCNTFSPFGFEIQLHKDLPKVTLFDKLKTFSEKDFTDYGCVVVAILTHGTGNGLLRAKDEGQLYSELDIINQFKVHSKPTLMTKPIVVIIQACRGTGSTKGMAVMQRLKINKDSDDEMEPYYLPVESDMLILHSSFVGKPSFRPENGSWFIQTFCKFINELAADLDLESILTEVKKEVAISKYYMEHNKSTGEMDVNKQMPVVTSTLIRKLFLSQTDKTPIQKASVWCDFTQKIMLQRYKESPPICPPINLGTETDSDGRPGCSSDQMEACPCFRNHFDYMKMCLRYFVRENPRDTTAKGLLTVANLENGANYEKAKATLITISSYLQEHSRGADYHKYMYFYGRDTAIDGGGREGKDHSLSKNVISTWKKLSQNHVTMSLGACVGAFVIYNFVNHLK